MTAISDIVTKASAGAYGEDSEMIAAIAGWVMAVKFDKGFGPFICGTMGKEDTDGLHDAYMICPTYGADVNYTAIYRRT
jgi:hypothetical protein